MSGAGNNESVRAPNGGSSGEGREQEIYFAYSATLRIFGDIPDLDEITERLGVTPSGTHRKGDRGWGLNLPPYERDMWSYNAPVKKAEALHVHVDALWNTFRERKEYLLQLKRDLKVDVFLGYRSNCDHATTRGSKCLIKVWKCSGNCKYPSDFQSSWPRERSSRSDSATTSNWSLPD